MFYLKMPVIVKIIQGHRKRWTGFETAITVRVSTDWKLKPSNKKL